MCRLSVCLSVRPSVRLSLSERALVLPSVCSSVVRLSLLIFFVVSQG